MSFFQAMPNKFASRGGAILPPPPTHPAPPPPKVHMFYLVQILVSNSYVVFCLEISLLSIKLDLNCFSIKMSEKKNLQTNMDATILLS